MDEQPKWDIPGKTKAELDKEVEKLRRQVEKELKIWLNISQAFSPCTDNKKRNDKKNK